VVDILEQMEILGERNTLSIEEEWLQRLAIDSNIATVLGSVPASSDAVEYYGRKIKQC
jgi:hypothetical protein